MFSWVVGRLAAGVSPEKPGDAYVPVHRAKGTFVYGQIESDLPGQAVEKWFFSREWPGKPTVCIAVTTVQTIPYV